MIKPQNYYNFPQKKLTCIMNLYFLNRTRIKSMPKLNDGLFQLERTRRELFHSLTSSTSIEWRRPCGTPGLFPAAKMRQHQSVSMSAGALRYASSDACSLNKNHLRKTYQTTLNTYCWSCCIGTTMPYCYTAQITTLMAVAVVGMSVYLCLLFYACVYSCV